MLGLKTMVACLGLVGGVFASPLAERRPDVGISSRSISLNGWSGFQSFGNFDDFFGRDNFDGRNNFQNVIFQENLVCRAVDVRFIQQKLAVIQELAKRIILEQICEVELQVVIAQQFGGGHNVFLDDLRRNSGRNVGFDRDIAGRFGDIFRDDGFFNDVDFGFNGFDVGRNLFVPGGNNWIDDSRRSSVELAFLSGGRALRRED